MALSFYSHCNVERAYSCLCVNSLITLVEVLIKIIFYFFLNVLQPRRADLDMNQHVNNVTYIGWVLEVCCLLLK